MPPPQAKDQSIHATADLDLENDPRTKHKVERCLSPSVHPSPTGAPSSPPSPTVPPRPGVRRDWCGAAVAHSRRERALVRADRLHLTPTRTLTLTLPLTRCELTGFTRDEAIGNTCRMLQGPATCSQALGLARALSPAPAPTPALAPAPAPAPASAIPSLSLSLSLSLSPSPSPSPNPDPNPHPNQALGALEAALKRRQPLTLRLLNYDATRTPFMNTLQA